MNPNLIELTLQINNITQPTAKCLSMLTPDRPPLILPTTYLLKTNRRGAVNVGILAATAQGQEQRSNSDTLISKINVIKVVGISHLIFL